MRIGLTAQEGRLPKKSLREEYTKTFINQLEKDQNFIAENSSKKGQIESSKSKIF